MKKILVSIYNSIIYRYYHYHLSILFVLFFFYSFAHCTTLCVYVLCSILMMRTCDVILTEVDDQTQPLVLPEFGHCSQELVNLVITGRAVTNVHDGDKILG